MYQIFTIHSLVGGHLGCFNFLVTVIRAAMLMAEQVSACAVGCQALRYMIIMYYDKSGKDGSSRFIFVFWGLPVLISRVAAAVYNYTYSECGVPFPYILSSICCMLFC